MEALHGLASYDPDTGLFVRVCDKARAKAGDEIGWLDGDGYRRTKLEGKTLFLHVVAWELMNGPVPQGMEVDHRDGNPANNAISNLRLATKGQNMHNSRIRKTNTTGFKGVNWNKSSGKFQVQLMLDRKKIHGGYFESAEEANVVAMQLRAAAHGEFCRHA